MSSTKTSPALRLRVFAGPNGSGKSTIIKSVREYRVNGQALDFGIYVNADDIASDLRKGGCNFAPYEISTHKEEFESIALASGLINDEFDEQKFKSCFKIQNNKCTLKSADCDERLAQIIADFLRKKLLAGKKKFSFETVFSHPGKLDIMKQAVEAGYKVYLYFVATSSPLINIDRVAARKISGGHDVKSDKIKSRYVRSLNLLHDAAQLAYQCFVYDNSKAEPVQIAHFKVVKGKKQWDALKLKNLPDWFVEYYLNKVHK